MRTVPKTYHSIDQIETLRLRADRAARKNGRRGWTITRLAEEIGVSEQAYYLWKSGKSRTEASIVLCEKAVEKMRREIRE